MATSKKTSAPAPRQKISPEELNAPASSKPEDVGHEKKVTRDPSHEKKVTRDPSHEKRIR